MYCYSQDVQICGQDHMPKLQVAADTRNWIRGYSHDSGLPLLWAQNRHYRHSAWLPLSELCGSSERAWLCRSTRVETLQEMRLAGSIRRPLLHELWGSSAGKD